MVRVRLGCGGEVREAEGKPTPVLRTWSGASGSFGYSQVGGGTRAPPFDRTLLHRLVWSLTMSSALGGVGFGVVPPGQKGVEGSFTVLTSTGQKRKRWGFQGRFSSGARHLRHLVTQAVRTGVPRNRLRRLVRTFHKRSHRRRASRLHRWNCIKAQRAAPRARVAAGKARLGLLTWNARGLGASFSRYDQDIKFRCFLSLLTRRKIGLAILTDLK